MSKLDSTQRFEILARIFQKHTGYWPPGKDRPAALGDIDEQESRDMWTEWNLGYKRLLDAMFLSIDEVLGDD